MFQDNYATTTTIRKDMQENKTGQKYYYDGLRYKHKQKQMSQKEMTRKKAKQDKERNRTRHRKDQKKLLLLL